MASDRIAIVTGTSSGIGAAIAEALLREEWTVVGVSRREAEFSDGDYQHLKIDLADLEQLADLANRNLAPLLQRDHWKRVGLVNNAGDIGSMLGLEQFDPRDVAKVYAVNAIAPIFLMGFVLRNTAPTIPLRIVNISTGAAVQAATGSGDYGSSKAALRHAGMTLAAELASVDRPGGDRGDVSILSYAPGVVDTPMQEAARAHDGPWSKRFVNFHARGMLQPPEGPAEEVVEFLTGDDWQPFDEWRFEPS